MYVDVLGWNDDNVYAQSVSLTVIEHSIARCIVMPTSWNRTVSEDTFGILLEKPVLWKMAIRLRPDCILRYANGT